MFIARMYYFCRELEGDAFWASVENGCRKARVERPNREAALQAKGYRAPLSPPVNPFFYDPSDHLNTKDVTQEAISRAEQIFGPMRTAATELMRAPSKVPFEPALFEFTFELQISPPEGFPRIQAAGVDHYGKAISRSRCTKLTDLSQSCSGDFYYGAVSGLVTLGGERRLLFAISISRRSRT